ncbi:MAG: beta-ketoacyl-ACP synthase 3 [Verrucomicrobia bacterium]|nr:beta-ketoacyl-ACP synthase 3 [Verrucomicrobiota bacterium]
MTHSRILGTGHYLPPKVTTNADLEKVMDTTDAFIVERTGIRSRFHAEAGVSASDLGALAAQAAVADAGLKMNDIDLLIMNTITPDHADPGCVCFLGAKLGLVGVAAFDIRQQCTGLLYGMAMADAFIKSGKFRHPLIVCSEVLSKRIDCSNDGRNIAILFGDGAGAVVMGPCGDDKRGVLWTGIHADGRGAKALYTAAPGSALGRMDHITKEDIDAGRVHFRMDGKAVFENGVAGMTGAAFEALEATGLKLSDVDVLIPHQANLRMLETVVKKTGIAKEKVFINVEDHGNIASACLPIALDEARKQGMVTDGKLVLLVGFGSGFVWGSALVRM